MPPRERVWAGTLAAGALTLLVVAGSLRPETAGHGTHEQLGLPACGFAANLGAPCVTCGMTTSFALASEGRLVEAAIAQPFGAALSLGTAAGFWVCAYVAATGSRVGRAALSRLTPGSLWWIGGAAAAAWAYKAWVWPG